MENIDTEKSSHQVDSSRNRDFLDYIFLSEQIRISHQYFAFTMNHPPAGCWPNNLRLLSAGSENWRVAV
jgi:hypothetical protein